ncbi:MAG: FxsA family protein [Ornithinimicrobium sp.]
MSTHAGAATPRKRRGRWILLILLLVPLLEIVTIIAVGQAVGPWWTFGALIVLSIVGAAVVHREGRRTWHRLREAISRGTTPAKELTDAGLVLVGGALLLTPGFLTDAIGFFLVLPVTRPLTRVWLQAIIASRLLGTFGSTAPMTPGHSGGRTYRPGAGEIIEGEVVRDSDSD